MVKLYAFLTLTLSGSSLPDSKHYLQGKSPWHQLNRRLGRCQNLSEDGHNKKSLPGIKAQLDDCNQSLYL